MLVRRNELRLVRWPIGVTRQQYAALIEARGAQWSRDSERDFKVVGGKVVELREGDPVEDEDGID